MNILSRFNMGDIRRMSMPVAFAAVVLGLIVPLPSSFVSLLIAVNISLALLIVLIILQIREALEISVFPTLLVVLTILRIMINVSVMRLILGSGNAGQVIHSFGHFVVKGNLIVGLAVFFILTVIQFVLTSGAGRVAEVAARFTLDAMPVKQMSIEGRLNSGQITDREAEQARKQLERESDFYGAMDGASKMVKFDAIAAVIIVIINLIGGITTGILQKHLGVTAALHTYALLTIGDGLAAMVPALLMSVSTTLLVTRSSSEQDLSNEVLSQLGRNSNTLFAVGGVMLVMAVIPGMPKLPFFILSALLLGLGYASRRRNQFEAVQVRREAEEERQAALAAPPEVRPVLAPDPMELVIGYGLVPLLAEEGGGLSERVTRMRSNLAAELGFAVPKVRIRDNVKFEANHYEIKLRAETVASGEVMPGYLLVINPLGGPIAMPGIDTVEPTYGHAAKWVSRDDEQQAIQLGYQAIDPVSQILTHIAHVIRAEADDLLTLEMVGSMIDELRTTHPTTVNELIPDKLSLGELHQVLQLLLAEGVPVKDLELICTVLTPITRQARNATTGQITDMSFLAEACRLALRRTIVTQHLDELTGKLQAVVVSPQIEQEITGSVVQGAFGPTLGLAADRMQAIGEGIVNAYNQAQENGKKPVILCGVGPRRYLHQLLAKFSLSLPVLSYEEIPPGIEMESVAVAQAARSLPEAQAAHISTVL
jgi:flagellar biosynthesis protein FlhA